MDSWEKKKKKKKLVLDPTLEKEEGFQFQTSTGMNARMGKPEYPGGKNISQMQCKPYESMILLLMRVSLPSKLRRIKKKEKKETHTYTLTQSYMCIYVLMQYGLVVLLNVLGCWLTYLGQAEAWFNIALHPRKPEGSKGRTAQDGHLDPHTAPELWLTQYYDKLQ